MPALPHGWKQKQREEQERTQGGGVDYRNHTGEIRKKYQNLARQVNEDYTLTDEMRKRKLQELGREYRTEFNEGKKAAEESFEAHLARLQYAADPPPVRGRYTAAELLERDMLRRDLERRWSRSEEHVMNDYRTAVSRRDILMAELCEEYGPEFIKSQELRREFAAVSEPYKRSRMPAQQQRALEQLEQLQTDESGIFMAMAHQDQLVGSEIRNWTNTQPTRTRDTVLGEQGIENLPTENIGGSDAA